MSKLTDLRIRLVGTDASPKVGSLARPARPVLRPVLRTMFNVELQGIENLPTSGPAILSPNHRSFFDSPLLMILAPRPVVFLGKAEYMDSRKTKYLFPAFGH